MKINEQDIIQEMRKGSVRAFTLCFQNYYRDLVLFAGGWLCGEGEACEDIVQEIFTGIWNNRRKLPEIVSLKSYLLKAVQNRCINYLKHTQEKRKYLELNSLSSTKISYETEEYILYSELNRRLQDALSHLSSQQRQCFVMNRIDGMKQARIAEELGMPLRTVELRIAESLKILKCYLKEYYLLVCLLLLH